jgi:hypothetical protein
MWRRKRAYRKGAPTGSARGAFVVGCQRSGTDMTLWTLDKSRDVDRYDENHRAAFRDCRIRDRETRERLIARSNAKRVIFKPVCDSHNTAKLLDDHDGAKAIWVYRHYRDVANSAVARWGDMNLRYVRDLARGGGDWGRRQWNRELITPERQAEIEHWCAGDLNAHGAAAVYWLLVNRTFFDQQLNRHDRVTVARYEDLVTSPEPEFRRICDALDVEFRGEMIETIFASSVRKSSQQPIAPGIEDACEALLKQLDQVRARARAAVS